MPIAPLPSQLAAGMREVRAANEPKFEPLRGVDNLSALGIRHVVLIVKENRTYDQVFGDMPQGNGEPKLAIYGRQVTPNHHLLAKKYVLLDNFYASGAISFEGHQWLMQGFVSDYVERALQPAPRGYAWNMSDAVGHRCGVPALANPASNRYPLSSMRIPDQIRAGACLEELAERE